MSAIYHQYGGDHALVGPVTVTDLGFGVEFPTTSARETQGVSLLDAGYEIDEGSVHED